MTLSPLGLRRRNRHLSLIVGGKDHRHRIGVHWTDFGVRAGCQSDIVVASRLPVLTLSR